MAEFARSYEIERPNPGYTMQPEHYPRELLPEVRRKIADAKARGEEPEEFDLKVVELFESLGRRDESRSRTATSDWRAPRRSAGDGGRGRNTSRGARGKRHK